MGLVFSDAAKEPASNTGAGPFNMSGTAFDASCTTLLAGIGNGNQSYFVAYDPVGAKRMVFLGTVTTGTPVTVSVDKVLNNGGVGQTFANAPILWCDFAAYHAALWTAGAAQTMASNAGAL